MLHGRRVFASGSPVSDIAGNPPNLPELLVHEKDDAVAADLWAVEGSSWGATPLKDRFSNDRIAVPVRARVSR